MVSAKHLFSGVAEGPMPNVMQQCGTEYCCPIGVQLRVGAGNAVKGATDDRQNTQRMGKARTFCPVKGEAGWTQLPNPAQPLEGGGIN
jgi:hypothetical protein